MVNILQKISEIYTHEQWILCFDPYFSDIYSHYAVSQDSCRNLGVSHRAGQVDGDLHRDSPLNVTTKVGFILQKTRNYCHRNKLYVLTRLLKQIHLSRTGFVYPNILCCEHSVPFLLCPKRSHVTMTTVSHSTSIPWYSWYAKCIQEMWETGNPLFFLLLLGLTTQILHGTWYSICILVINNNLSRKKLMSMAAWSCCSFYWIAYCSVRIWIYLFHAEEREISYN